MNKVIALSIATALLAGMGIAAHAAGGDREGKYFRRGDGPMGEMRMWDHGRRGGPGGQFGMLRMLDTDMDRSVSLEEFLQLNNARFKNADKNGDGALDDAEIDAIVAARVKAMRERMLERLDGDKDGKISAAEFNAPQEKWFSELDRNDDNMLNRDDMPRGDRGRGDHHRRWRHD